MGERKRIKSSALYHAEPKLNACFMMPAERLNNKLKRGSITKEELSRLVELKPKSKPIEREYYITILGIRRKVSREDYLEYCRVFNN